MGKMTRLRIGIERPRARRRGPPSCERRARAARALARPARAQAGSTTARPDGHLVILAGVVAFQHEAGERPVDQGAQARVAEGPLVGGRARGVRAWGMSRRARGRSCWQAPGRAARPRAAGAARPGPTVPSSRRLPGLAPRPRTLGPAPVTHSCRSVRGASRAAVRRRARRARGCRRCSSRRWRPMGAGAARPRGPRARSSCPPPGRGAPAEPVVDGKPSDGHDDRGVAQPHERVRPGPAALALVAVGRSVAAAAWQTPRVALRDGGEREPFEHGLVIGDAQRGQPGDELPSGGAGEREAPLRLRDSGRLPDDQRALPLARPEDRRRVHPWAHAAPGDRSVQLRERADASGGMGGHPRLCYAPR